MENNEECCDVFRREFKRYKNKNPPPNFADVIDFRNCQKDLDQIVTLQLSEPDFPCIDGLHPVSSWKAYSFRDHPGFTFIVNPFTDNYERYWIKRCVEDYTRPPHKSNLDSVVGHGNWNSLSFAHLSSTDQNQLDKLHWVTLGYHHNWDTKVYSPEDHSDLPIDLCLLMQYIAACFGFNKFQPQAAILNYYQLTSSLGGHVDHSEHDFSAPLISLSFGCSAIYLLGGTCKAVKPVAVYIDEGDIVVMSGQSRLAYHAVPRILRTADRQQQQQQKQQQQQQETLTPVSPADKELLSDPHLLDSSQVALTDTVSPHVTDISQSHVTDSSIALRQSVASLNVEMKNVLATLNWSQFKEFLNKTRLNINARQVFHR